MPDVKWWRYTGFNVESGKRMVGAEGSRPMTDEEISNVEASGKWRDVRNEPADDQPADETGRQGFRRSRR